MTKVQLTLLISLLLTLITSFMFLVPVYYAPVDTSKDTVNEPPKIKHLHMEPH